LEVGRHLTFFDLHKASHHGPQASHQASSQTGTPTTTQVSGDGGPGATKPPVPLTDTAKGPFTFPTKGGTRGTESTDRRKGKSETAPIQVRLHGIHTTEVQEQWLRGFSLNSVNQDSRKNQFEALKDTQQKATPLTIHVE